MRVWVKQKNQSAANGLIEMADRASDNSIDKLTTLTYLFGAYQEDEPDEIQKGFRAFVSNLDDLPDLEAILINENPESWEIQVVLASDMDLKNFSLAVARAAKVLVRAIEPMANAINGKPPPGHRVGFDPIGTLVTGASGDYTNEVILPLTPSDSEGITCPITIRLIYVMEGARPVDDDAKRAPINQFQIRLRKEDQGGGSTP